MALLKDDDRQKIESIFEAVAENVTLVMFTRAHECDYCQTTRELVQELAALNDKVTAEVYDFVADEALAKEYSIDKIPAVVVRGDTDYGIRFYGVPAGYEFMSLIEAIVDVGKRDHGLPANIVAQLARVDQPVRMQAMVSPTCPYCPRAVRTAHKFAMASEHITGDMVEISEFPHLAVKYSVQGVPNTIVNDKESVLGAQPEGEFVKAILKSIGG
jgi:glutaredoxin-like protein